MWAVSVTTVNKPLTQLSSGAPLLWKMKWKCCWKTTGWRISLLVGYFYSFFSSWFHPKDSLPLWSPLRLNETGVDTARIWRGGNGQRGRLKLNGTWWARRKRENVGHFLKRILWFTTKSRLDLCVSPISKSIMLKKCALEWGWGALSAKKGHQPEFHLEGGAGQLSPLAPR